MGQNKQTNILKKIVTNIYVKNILMMIVIALLLIGSILFYLKRYTRHDQSVSVPEVKSIQLKDAESILESASLKYEVIDSIYQEEGAPGTILDQVPKANIKVKEGRTVYLTIQTANEPSINIPDLQYASLRQAEALLKAVGFAKPNVKFQNSEFKDLVLGVNFNGITPKAGEKLPKSSVLTLVVGDGYGSDSQDVDSLSDGQITENMDYEESF